MLDAWKAEKLMVYAIMRTLFPITASQQSYSIGLSAANFTIERPEKIEQAGIIYPTGPLLELPLRIVTAEEWANEFSIKELQSTSFTAMYYQPTTPNGTIWIWPIPLQGWQIALYTWQTINTFAALTDVVILPPAYQEAIEYNLAVRLSTKFPDTAILNPAVMQIAIDTKAQVKRVNTLPLPIGCDGAVTSHGSALWDWRTGDYVRR